MSRRSLISALVIGLLSLMTLTGIILALSTAAGDGMSLGLGGRIAVLEIDGVITDDADFLEDVRELRRDPSIRGWVVAINSPGGAVGPSQSIYQELRRLREDRDEPVIASIGSVGASGGYYVALAADSIMALPGSITGSIGVLMEFPNVSELLDRVGVSMEVVKGGEQKDIGSPFRGMDADDRALLNTMVEDVHAQFIEVVAAERRMAVEDVVPLADGRIFSGRQARAAGLIDRFGNVQEAVRLAGRMAELGDDPRTIRPSEEEGWLAEALFGQATVTAIRGLVRPLRGGWPSLQYIVH